MIRCSGYRDFCCAVAMEERFILTFRRQPPRRIFLRYTFQIRTLLRAALSGRNRYAWLSSVLTIELTILRPKLMRLSAALSLGRKLLPSGADWRLRMLGEIGLSSLNKQRGLWVIPLWLSLCPPSRPLVGCNSVT